MLKTRTTKTGSGNTAVQVVCRQNQKTKIVKHIGTAVDNKELKKLFDLADQYILSCSLTKPLLPEVFKKDFENHLVSIENLSFTNTYHHFASEFLLKFYQLVGFDKLKNNLLRDLSFMRIIEPCSKLRSIELHNAYFGSNYTQNILYKALSKNRPLKEDAEKIAVAYAKKSLSFDFSLVFYDVTTLYFETFKADEDSMDGAEIVKKGLRKNGFSKDNKSNQPQIVIGLIVTKEGFPVSFDVFEGSTFEGKTFIPSISKFKDAHKVKTLTVVADAAMISLPNIESLIENNLSYIVGARMASLKPTQIKQINEQLIGKREDQQDLSIQELREIDKASIRIETERGLLVCDFSETRYKKDKWEMEKQITKARKLLEKNQGLKRTKFIKNCDDGKTEQELNTQLIEKTKLLLGIKGYYTNLTDGANKTIIDHYHNLWHVEKAFRIAKSDLQARPIFHHKRESIETHILIVFVSLCIAKAIELKTDYSIKKVRDMIWRIQDIEFIDTLTNRQFLKRMVTTGNPMAEFMKNMNHVLKG